LILISDVTSVFRRHPPIQISCDLCTQYNHRQPARLSIPETFHCWRPPSRTWNQWTSPSTKQLTWLRIVHSGDWCLRLVLHTP